jgi:hypothetical protein
MADAEFVSFIDEAKKLEKKLVDYSPYKGAMEIERTMDLEPKEYLDLTYPDLINLYERTQKIISTASMLGGMASAGPTSSPDAQAEAPKQTAATQEIESRLKEMTSETLHDAEQVGKEPIVIEQQLPAETKPAESSMTIEFETKPAEKAPEIEIERETKPEIEIEKEVQEAKKGEEEITIEKEGAAEEKRTEPTEAQPAPEPERPKEIAQKPSAPRTEEIQVPAERQVIVAAIPPALNVAPESGASKRYLQMEEQVRAAVGEKADEMTLKKKMLELTKGLFKEKSFDKREEIKIQITILKNMLSGAGSKATPARKGKGDEAHMKMLDALGSTHQAELAQTKDGIIDSYSKQIASIKKKFYEDIASTDDSVQRKKIFESFVFSVTSLVEQLPEVIAKYKDFTAKKHIAELESLRSSLAPEEKDAMKAVAARMESIDAKYAQEFAGIKGIIAHQIDNLIEITGSEILKKQGQGQPTKADEKEGREYDAVKEINEMADGTLLVVLHSSDPAAYGKYERKEISKAEAIFRAKELIARKRGLKESMVKKYFTHKEAGR